MVGGGSALVKGHTYIRYRCPNIFTPTACAHPQTINEQPAMRTLRDLFPIIAAEGERLADRTKALAAHSAKLDELRRSLTIKKQQVESAAAEWFAQPPDRRSDFAYKMILDGEAELKKLTEQLKREESRQFVSGKAAELCALLAQDPAHLYEMIDDELRGEILRTFVRGVQIEAEGTGTGRKFLDPARLRTALGVC
jgi:hypothetical protein